MFTPRRSFVPKLHQHLPSPINGKPVGPCRPDIFPLVAGNRDAFVNPGDSIVGHGGIAIEEVIVPLVEFERKQR